MYSHNVDSALLQYVLQRFQQITELSHGECTDRTGYSPLSNVVVVVVVVVVSYVRIYTITYTYRHTYVRLSHAVHTVRMYVYTHTYMHVHIYT